MRFRRALHLGDLRERLVPCPRRNVGRVELPAPSRPESEHLPVRRVRVVGDRQRVEAVRALLIHPRPQRLRVHGVDPRERDRRGGVAAKYDVAVQVAAVDRIVRRVLVGDEGRELAGHVVTVRRLDGSRPRLPRVLWPVVQSQVDEVGRKRGRLSLPVGPRVAHPPRQAMVVQRVGRILRRIENAQEERMVRYGVEVERPVDPHLEAARMPDRLALREPVGIVGTGPRAEDVGVERVAGVDVQVAEVDVGRLVGPRRRCDHGKQPDPHPPAKLVPSGPRVSNRLRNAQVRYSALMRT